MKKLFFAALLILSIQTSNASTNGYYCQVDIPETISGYYEIYYRMTKTQIWGSTNYAVQVDKVLGNILSIENEVQFTSRYEMGRYIKIDETGHYPLFHIGAAVAGFPIEMTFTSLEYNELYNVPAVMNGMNTVARCQRVSNSNYPQ